MNRADEMVVQIEAIERDLAGVAASSDEKLNQELRAALEELKTVSRHWKPVEDLHNLLSRISHHLDFETSERKTIHRRLISIEREMKRRGSGVLVRCLVAFCIGAAGTSAWDSYGEATKHMIATTALELGWPSQARQMIASWIQQLGWTKALARPEGTARETLQAAPVAQPAPEVIGPKAPATPRAPFGTVLELRM